MRLISNILNEKNSSYENCILIDEFKKIRIDSSPAWNTEDQYFKIYKGDKLLFNGDYINAPNIKMCRLSIYNPIYVTAEDTDENLILSKEEIEEIISILNSPNEDCPEDTNWVQIIANINMSHDEDNFYKDYLNGKEWVDISYDISIPDYTKLTSI